MGEVEVELPVAGSGGGAAGYYVSVSLSLWFGLHAAFMIFGKCRTLEEYSVPPGGHIG